jgi:hypothetical protein
MQWMLQEMMSKAQERKSSVSLLCLRGVRRTVNQVDRKRLSKITKTRDHFFLNAVSFASSCLSGSFFFDYLRRFSLEGLSSLYFWPKTNGDQAWSENKERRQRNLQRKKAGQAMIMKKRWTRDEINPIKARETNKDATQRERDHLFNPVSLKCHASLFPTFVVASEKTTDKNKGNLNQNHRNSVS